MKEPENQSALILTIHRPLIDLDNKALAAMLLQAEFLAERAGSSQDRESFSTKLLLATAYNMREQAELEIASRN